MNAVLKYSLHPCQGELWKKLDNIAKVLNILCLVLIYPYFICLYESERLALSSRKIYERWHKNNLKLNENMQNQVLAIDIQRDQISTAVLSSDLKKTKVQSTVDFPLNTRVSGDSLAESLDRALGKITHEIQEIKTCVVSLPGFFFFFRSLHLPFDRPRKINQILHLELEPHLPLEDFVTTFDILPGQGISQINTLSISPAILESLDQVLKAHGLTPALVTPGDGYALATLAALSVSGFQVFIHQDSNATGAYLLEDGRVVAIRYTEPDTDPLSLCRFMNEQLPGRESIDGIILSAPGPAMDALQKTSGLPVEIFTMDTGTPAQTAMALGACHAREIPIHNFRPGKIQSKIWARLPKGEIMVSGLLLILFLLAAGGGKLMEIHRLETRVTKVEAAIQKEFFSVFPRRTPLVDALHQTRMELKNQQSHPATATGPLNVDLLTQISRALPSSMDIGFSQFTRTENQVKIMGNADQFSTVEKMKGQLAPLFKSVDILSAAMDKGSKRIKFNLSIGL